MPVIKKPVIPENGYIDPNTGLMYDRNTGSLSESNIDDLKPMTYQDYLQSEYETDLMDDADIGYGESQFDEGFNLTPYSTREELDTYRSEQQGIGHVLGAGLGQLAVNAATTIVDDTVGTAFGLAEGLYETFKPGGKGFTTGYTQNKVSTALNDFRKNVTKELFPIYESKKSRGEFLNGESFGNWVGTSLGSMGYMFGSMATTGAVSGTVNKLFGLGKLQGAISTKAVANQLGKNAALGEKASSESAKYLASLVKGDVKTGDFVKGLKEIESKYNRRSSLANMTSAYVGAQAESRMEGLEAKENYIAKYRATAEKKAKEKAHAAGLEAAQKGTYQGIEDPTEIYKLVSGQAYEKALATEMAILERDSESLANNVYAANSVILSASGVITAGRSLSPSFKANRRIHKDFIQKTADKGYELVKPKGFGLKSKVIAATSPIVESFEESSQGAIKETLSKFSGDKYKYGVNSISLSLEEAYDKATSVEGLKEAGSGFFSGTMSVPTYTNETAPDTYDEAGNAIPGESKRKLKFIGGIASTIEEQNEKLANTQRLVDEKNQVLEENKEELEYLDRAQIITEGQKKAVEENDEFNYRSLEDDNLLNLAFKSISGNMYSDIRGKFQDNTKMSAEDAAEIRKSVEINNEDLSKQIREKGDIYKEELYKQYDQSVVDYVEEQLNEEVEPSEENQAFYAENQEAINQLMGQLAGLDQAIANELAGNYEKSKNGVIDPYAEYTTDEALASALNKKNEETVERLDLINSYWQDISSRLDVSKDVKEELVRDLYQAHRSEQRGLQLARNLAKNVKSIDPVAINELEQVAANIEGMNSTIDAATKLKNRQNGIRKKTENFIANKTEKVEELSQPLNFISNKVVDTVNSLEGVETKLEETTKQLSKLKITDDGITTILDKLNNYKENVTEANSKINDVANTIARYKEIEGVIASGEATPTDIQELSEIRKELSTLVSDLSTGLSKKLDISKAEKAELKSKLSTEIDAKVQEIKDSYKDKETKDNLEKELADLEAERDILDKNLISFDEELKKLEEPIKKLEKSMSSSKKTLDRYNKLLAKSDKRIQDLGDELAALEVEKDDLSKKTITSATKSNRPLSEITALADNYVEHYDKLDEESRTNLNIEDVIRDLNDIKKLAYNRKKFAVKYTNALRDPRGLEEAIEKQKKEGLLSKEERTAKRRADSLKKKFDQGVEFSDGEFFYGTSEDGQYIKYSKKEDGSKENISILSDEEINGLDFTKLKQIQVIPDGGIEGVLGNEVGYLQYQKLDNLEEQLAEQIKDETSNAKDDKVIPVEDDSNMEAPDTGVAQNVTNKEEFEALQKEISEIETSEIVMKNYQYTKYKGVNKKTGKTEYSTEKLIDTQARGLMALAKFMGYDTVTDMVIANSSKDDSKKKSDTFAHFEVPKGFSAGAAIRDLVNKFGYITLKKNVEFVPKQYTAISLWRVAGNYKRNYPGKKKGAVKYDHPMVNGKKRSNLPREEAMKVVYKGKTESGNIIVEYNGETWYANPSNVNYYDPNAKYGFYAQYYHYLVDNGDGTYTTSKFEKGKRTEVEITEEDFKDIKRIEGVSDITSEKDGKKIIIIPKGGRPRYNDADGKNAMKIPRQLDKLKIKKDLGNGYLIQYFGSVGTIYKPATFTNVNGVTRELTSYEIASFRSKEDIEKGLDEAEGVIYEDPDTSVTSKVKDKKVFFETGLLNQTITYIGDTAKTEEAFIPSAGVKEAFDAAYGKESASTGDTSLPGDFSGTHKKYVRSLTDIKSKDEYYPYEKKDNKVGDITILSKANYQAELENRKSASDTSSKKSTKEDIAKFQMHDTVRSQNWINSKSQKELQEHKLTVLTGEQLGYTDPKLKDGLYGVVVDKDGNFISHEWIDGKYEEGTTKPQSSKVEQQRDKITVSNVTDFNDSVKSGQGFTAFNSNNKSAQDSVLVTNGLAMVSDGMGSYGNSKGLADKLLAEIANLTTINKESVTAISNKVAKKFEDAAATLAIVKKNTDGSFTYISIGDSPIYITRNDGTIEEIGVSSSNDTAGVIALESKGMLPGLITGNITLKPGENIFVSSDGLGDALEYFKEAFRLNKAEFGESTELLDSVFISESPKYASLADLISKNPQLKGFSNKKEILAMALGVDIIKEGSLKFIKDGLKYNPQLLTDILSYGKEDDLSIIVLDNSFKSSTKPQSSTAFNPKTAVIQPLPLPNTEVKGDDKKAAIYRGEYQQHDNSVSKKKAKAEQDRYEALYNLLKTRASEDKISNLAIGKKVAGRAVMPKDGEGNSVDNVLGKSEDFIVSVVSRNSVDMNGVKVIGNRGSIVALNTKNDNTHYLDAKLINDSDTQLVSKIIEQFVNNLKVVDGKLSIPKNAEDYIIHQDAENSFYLNDALNSVLYTQDLNNLTKDGKVSYDELRKTRQALKDEFNALTGNGRYQPEGTRVEEIEELLNETELSLNSLLQYPGELAQYTNKKKQFYFKQSKAPGGNIVIAGKEMTLVDQESIATGKPVMNPEITEQLAKLIESGTRRQVSKSELAKSEPYTELLLVDGKFSTKEWDSYKDYVWAKSLSSPQVNTDNYNNSGIKLPSKLNQYLTFTSTEDTYDPDKKEEKPEAPEGDGKKENKPEETTKEDFTQLLADIKESDDLMELFTVIKGEDAFLDLTDDGELVPTPFVILDEVLGMDHTTMEVSEALEPYKEALIEYYSKLNTGSKKEEGTKPTVPESTEDVEGTKEEKSLEELLNDDVDPSDDDGGYVYEEFRLKSEGFESAEDTATLQKWWRNNLSTPLNILQPVYNSNAFGYVSNNVAYVYENAEIGTGYHEAFEVVYGHLLTTEEQTALIAEASNDPYYDDKIAKQRKIYGPNKSESSIIKEAIAEEFRDFVLDGGKGNRTKYNVKRRTFFSRIVNWFKEFVDKIVGNKTVADIEGVFNRLNQGYYKNAKVVNTEYYAERAIEGEREDFTSAVMANMNNMFFKRLFGDKTGTEFTEVMRTGLTPERREEILDGKRGVKSEFVALKQGYIKAYKANEANLEAAKKKKAINLIAGFTNKQAEIETKLRNVDRVIDKWDITDGTKQIFVEQLSTFGFEVMDQDEVNKDTVEIEQNGGRTNVFIDNATLKMSSKNSASSTIKFILSTLPEVRITKVKKDVKIKPIYDKFGFKKVVDFNKAFGILINKLEGTVNPEQMKEVLTTLAAEHEDMQWVELLMSRVGLNKLDEEVPQLSKSEFATLMEFTQVFAKNKNNMFTLVMGAKGETNMLDANLDTATGRVRQEWTNDSLKNKATIVGKDGLYKAKLPEKIMDNRAYISNRSTQKTNEGYINRMLENYAFLGINLSITKDNATQEDMAALSKVHDDLFLNIDEHKQPYLFSLEKEDDSNAEGFLRTISGIEVKYGLDSVENGYYTADGNLMYLNTVNNNMTDIINRINWIKKTSPKEEFYDRLAQYTNLTKDNVNLQNSYLYNNLQDIDLKYFILDTVVEGESGNTVDFSGMDTPERFWMWHNQHRKNYYPVLRPADKSREMSLSMGIDFYQGKDNYTDKDLKNRAYLKQLVGYLTDELALRTSRDWSTVKHADKNWKNGTVIDIVRNRGNEAMINSLEGVLAGETTIDNFLQLYENDLPSLFESYITERVDTMFDKAEFSLVKSGLVNKVAEDRYDNFGIDGSATPHSVNASKYYKKDLKKFVINTTVSPIEQRKIFVGDTMLFKSIVDIPKRMGGEQSPKRKSINDVRDSATERNFRKLYKFPDGSQDWYDHKGKAVTKMLVTKDDEFFSNYSYLGNRYGEKDDGFSIGTMDYYRQHFVRDGSWPTGKGSMEELYQYLMQREMLFQIVDGDYKLADFLTTFEQELSEEAIANINEKFDPELNLSKTELREYIQKEFKPMNEGEIINISKNSNKINSIKPQGYGYLSAMEKKDLVDNVSFMFKTSVLPISPSLYRNSDGTIKNGNFHGFATHARKEGYHVQATYSAVKGSSHLLQPDGNDYNKYDVTKTEDGLVGNFVGKPNPTLQVVEWDYLGDQLTTGYGVHHDQTKGSQASKQIYNNSFNKGRAKGVEEFLEVYDSMQDSITEVNNLKEELSKSYPDFIKAKELLDLVPEIAELSEVRHLLDTGLDLARKAEIGLQLNAEWLEKGVSGLKTKLGLVQQPNGDYVAKDNKHLIKTLTSEAKRRQVTDNIVDEIASLDPENSLLPVEALVNRNKIESILYALADKATIGKKLNGKPSYQVPATFFEDGNIKIIEQTDKRGRVRQYTTSGALKFYAPQYDRYLKDENNNDVLDEFGNKRPAKGARVTQVGSTEIMIPSYLKGVLKKGQVIGKENQELLKLIGFRIPTQGLNSMESMVVKEFLPDEYGDIIVVPAEIVLKAGSDFDIDKLNIYLPNGFINNNNEHVYINADMSYSDYFKQRKISFEKLTEEEFDTLALSLLFGEEAATLEDTTHRLAALLTSSTISDGASKIINDILDKTNSIKRFHSALLNKVSELTETLSEYKEGTSTYETRLAIIDDLVSTSNKLLSKEDVSKVLGISDFDIKQHENKMLENYHEIITHRGNFEQLVSSVESDDLQVMKLMSEMFNSEYLSDSKLDALLQKEDYKQALLDAAREYAKTTEGKAVLNKVAEIEFNNDMAKQNMEGAGTIGIAAIAATMHIQGQISNMYFDLDNIYVTEYNKEKELAGIKGGTEKVKLDVKLNLPHARVTIDGKSYISLGSDKDAAGKFISNNMNQSITATVDNAKDAILGSLNWGLKNFATVMMLQNMGVPMDTLNTFFNQPIIKYYNSLQETLESPVQLVNGKQYYRSNLIELALDKFDGEPITINNTADNYSENEKSFIRMQNKGIPSTNKEAKANYTKEELAMQRNVLRDYINYIDIQKYYSQGTGSIKYDTKAPKNTNEALYRLLLSEKVMKDNVIGNYGDMVGLKLEGAENNQRAVEMVPSDPAFNKGFITPYRKVFKEYLAGYKDISLMLSMPDMTNYVANIINKHSDILVNTNETNTLKMLDTFKSELLSFIAATSLLKVDKQTTQINTEINSLMNGNSSNAYTSVKDLMLDSTLSTPRKIKRIQDSIEAVNEKRATPFDKSVHLEFSENTLVASLIPILRDKAVDNLKLSDSKNSDVPLLNQYTSDWRDIFKYSPEFGAELIKFSIAQTGVGTGPMSFIGLAPHEEYAKFINQTLINLKGMDIDARQNILDTVWKLFRLSKYNDATLMPKVVTKTTKSEQGPSKSREVYSKIKFTSENELVHPVYVKWEKADYKKQVGNKKVDVFEPIIYNTLTKQPMVNMYNKVRLREDLSQTMYTVDMIDKVNSLGGLSNNKKVTVDIASDSKITVEESETDTKIKLIEDTLMFGYTEEEVQQVLKEYNERPTSQINWSLDLFLSKKYC